MTGINSNLQIYYTENGEYYTEEWNKGWIIHFALLSALAFGIGLAVLVLNGITIVLMYRHRTKQNNQSVQAEIRLSIQVR